MIAHTQEVSFLRSNNVVLHRGCTSYVVDILVHMKYRSYIGSYIRHTLLKIVISGDNDSRRIFDHLSFIIIEIIEAMSFFMIGNRYKIHQMQFL